MKTLSSLLVATLALAVISPARAELSAAAWLETYYLDPQPAELPHAIQRLSREGYFDRAGNIPIAIGFISTIFAQHPERVDAWLVELNGLPLKHQRLIAASLWQAGHPLGAELLPRLAEFQADRAAVASLASKPSTDILDTPVVSPQSMNLRWGAFLASGDERHIVAVLEAIGSDIPALGATAQRALAQDAAAHPRVLEICRAQLEREPEEIRSALRAALNDAAPAHPRS
ncbi:MAG TPA: hypothetical protein VHD62_15300 [Opitutaceae bacterium]|nr:hypothetical protein [Opitutaceae bacterium]